MVRVGLVVCVLVRLVAPVAVLALLLLALLLIALLLLALLALLLLPLLQPRLAPLALIGSRQATSSASLSPARQALRLRAYGAWVRDPPEPRP